jgi:tetratricopeptide (TPR) repeat protein
MTDRDSFHEMGDILLQLGYKDNYKEEILHELYVLFEEIGFDDLKQMVDSAREAKDTIALIASLKELMIMLEYRGYYRPDYPAILIRHLVNGLNIRNEDIFTLLSKSSISAEEKTKEQEFLASCAAITQLGYILLKLLSFDVKAASSGEHVFIIIDGFSPQSRIFVDFSIDSIRDIDIRQYRQEEDNCYLASPKPGMDEQTSDLVRRYYSFFHKTANIGLSHNIHNNLGMAYDKLERYEDAAEEYREALRLDPGYTEAHNNLAVAYNMMGLTEKAVQELQEAIRLKPDYIEAHTNLGHIHAMSGRYEEAFKELNTVLGLDPKYAAARNILGKIYASQKRNYEALKEFQEAVKSNPSYIPARINLGYIYSESGKYEDALEEFQKVLTIEPESPEGLFGMGTAYCHLGSYERAVRALIKAVCLDPDLLDYVPEKLLLKVRQGVSRFKGL